MTVDPPLAVPDLTHGRGDPRRVGDLLLRDDPAPVLVRPSDVGGTVAWQVLVRDGVLEVLRGDVACVSATRIDPALRAGTLRGAVPTGAVVTGRTAAWVHTGAGRPDSLDLACHPGGRRPSRPRGARLWQAPLLAPDVRVVAGVRLTTPDRTAVELALHDDGSTELLVALAAAGTDLDAVRRAVVLRPRVGVGVRRNAVAVVDAARAAAC
ncbi:hypothetical protein ATJ88_1982 [Isoptericola jiangsuensis]|uniref:Uncharacterized protein n=1 Tax=Isoptericola jiangsuensis TaxID=548579 RepID=A0A2A9EVZ0_9MICO|nr:hypothetical protein [Isoptericola jiangsuensis]PFG43297.1 hypothetical protein ATJ88_1982 [Isoptericola jiangsuensis]